MRKTEPKPRLTTEERKLRKELKDLTDTVRTYLAALDVVMLEPPSTRKGRRIARLSTFLDMANDRARHFTLELPLGEPKPQANAAGVEQFLDTLARQQDEWRRGGRDAD